MALLRRHYASRLIPRGQPGQYRVPHKGSPTRTRPRLEHANLSKPKSAGTHGFPSKLALGIFGSIAVFSGYYTFTVLKGISIESNQSRELDIDPDASSVRIYDHIAPYFDKQVGSNEWWLGISKLRKQVVSGATGDVLEVGVGTGRNHEYYKTKELRSITFLDASENMMAIASAKWNQRIGLPEWKEYAPDGVRRVNFKILSASDAVAPPILAGEKDNTGFTTIISTFTLCSMPHPADALTHLCSLLSKDTSQEPRIVLLEHGKSTYDWINNLLNNSAPAHAHKYGCWWNRDIGAIAEEAAQRAGMEIVTLRRKHGGTTWIVEMRPRARVVGEETASPAIIQELQTTNHDATESNAPTGKSSGRWWAS